MLHLRAALLAGASILISGHGAMAQSVPTAAAQTTSAPSSASTTPAGSGGAMLGEVVVTAQRRATSLQDVPFSIMAFAGDQVAQQHLTDANSLALKVPSAVFNAAADKGFAVVGLRGVRALLAAPAADLPVVFFFDDVYTSGVSSSGSSFFDIDRIEVLRGPQGTLFGRNVTGGAISIITKAPKFGFDWGGSITGGNFGQFGVEGFVNDELVKDKLAGRLSFQYQRNNGLFKNENGPDLQAGNVAALRGQLLWRATDQMTVKFEGDYLYDHGTSNPAKVTCVTRAGATCTPSLLPPLSSDPFTVNQNNDASYTIQYYGGQVRVDYDFGEAGALTSISAYRRNVNYSNRDPDSIPLSEYYLRAGTNERQFTQEIRFASPAQNRFSYVAGVFFLKQHNYRADTYHEQGIPGTPYGSTVPTLKNAILAQFSDNLSAAIFAEGAFKITPELTLSVGGRYSYDKKEGYTSITGDQGSPRFPVIPTFVNFGPTDFSAFTPRVYLKYEPNSDLNFYATIAKGYKGGGFSASQNSVVGLLTPFAPEKAINYEVGTKSRFLDRRLQVNLSLFHQKISNLQVTYFENGNSFTRSVGEALQQGVEAETAAELTRNFDVFANYAYLDAHYLKYSTGTANYAGNTMPFAPKHAITFGGRYRIDLPHEYMAQLSADYTYHSRLALADPNNVPDAVTARSVINNLNASIDITPPDGRWRVSFWGKNLTNDAAIQAAYEFGTFWLSRAEIAAGERGFLTYYTNPRTFGVTVSVKR